MSVKLRKKHIVIEETLHDGGPIADQPRKVGAIIAVIENPFAGQYHENIEWFSDELKPLGLACARELYNALGGDAAGVDGYGKGCITGENGEREHAALWHVPGGYSMRELLGDAKAIVPSTKKVGGPGTRIDIPITHCNASYVRGHFDAFEVSVTDAPQKNELAVILVMSCGSRIHDRCGGLKSAEIKGEDGLR